MTHDEHLDAICTVLEARLDAAPPVTARRLLRPQLRWVERQLSASTGGELARRLGVAELIESCRDEHLASLDADEGLVVLQIPWEEVVTRACERGADRVEQRCSRCGEPARQATGGRCPACGRRNGARAAR